LAHFTRAFRHRNYQLFFSGQLVSLTGTWMQSVAESWLVFRLTGSAALLGVTSFATLAPVFLFATLGGILADRLDRRRILIATQSISMVLPLTLAALTLSGHVRVWHVFVLATCLGIVNAFDIPARQSFVVEMVGREDLTNAIALNSSMVNGARVVGPAAAGLLVAAVGEGWCFLINGISYLAVIAGLAMMKAPRRPPPHARRSAWRDTLDGFRFATRTTPIRALLMLLGLLSFAGMPYSVLMPVFAESILGAGPKGLGLLMGRRGSARSAAPWRSCRAAASAASAGGSPSWRRRSAWR
jgi:MFS family permease